MSRMTMMTIHVTPELADRLERQVPHGKRSKYIRQAINAWLTLEPIGKRRDTKALAESALQLFGLADA